MDDLIYRQAAIDEANTWMLDCFGVQKQNRSCGLIRRLEDLPSAQPERLTDDDFETIRIHLNAYKEKLCNQHRWKEAEEYQRIIDRFIAFASAQRWIPCSKELPPYGKHVLTWWKGVIAIDCRVPGHEEYWLLNVEAWMPLPEPYKDGEQNETN